MRTRSLRGGDARLGPILAAVLVAACGAPAPSGSGPADAAGSAAASGVATAAGASASVPPSPTSKAITKPSLAVAPTPTGPANLPAGARITGVVPIPNSGALTVADGAVWAIDRGVPGDTVDQVRGRLIRIDPASLNTSVVAEKIIGAQVAIGAGSAWIASPFRDRLLRVDLGSHRVTELSTGTLTPEIVAAELRTIDQAEDYPYAVVEANGSVWVANHHAGSVARFDARTGKLVATIPVIEPGGSGPANLATDGKRVWVTASRSSEIFEIDASTNAVHRTYDVAPGWACGASTFDGTSIWVTSGHDQADPCHEDDAWSVSRVDPSTGSATKVDVGGRPMDVAVGLGAVWVVTDKPHPALVRLDPDTLKVVARLQLGLVPNITNPLEIGEGAIWVRVVDFWSDGMTPWPGMEGAQPSVLRIVPSE